MTRENVKFKWILIMDWMSLIFSQSIARHAADAIFALD